MDNFKATWNQVNIDSSRIELTLIEGKDLILEQLRMEQNLRKQYNPLIGLLIVLFALIFGYIVFLNSESFGILQVIGILLVILACISIVYLSQSTKIPLHQIEHDNSSTIFLGLVKDKLDHSKKMLIIGLVCQMLFLATGLYLLIFYNSNDHHIGYVFVFLSLIFGITGFGIGKSVAFFNQHYKSTYQIIDQFLRS